MHRVVLWDIDHTLIENNGVSKEIYAAAFTALADKEPQHKARTEGRTDRLIMRDLFLDHDLEPPAWDQIEPALTDAGAARLHRLRDRGTALPGVTAALRAFAARGDTIQSILTGNILANARVKLRAFDLDPYVNWDIGAYGADADDRTDLVDIARQRITRAHPEAAPVLRLVLIGDTPRDVRAAIDGGAGIIAVATGVDSAAELAAAGASTVFADLSDTAGLMTAFSELTA